MPYFNYVAVDSSGKELKGKIDAPNEETVAAELKKQGLFPTAITSQSAGPSVAAPKKRRGGSGLNISIGAAKIKRKELTVVTRQLATLLEAGLPLIRSLRTLERQAKSPITRRILGETADSVETGATFSEALSLNPKTFDRLFLNMVRAGEAAGAMETILDRLAQFMEKAAKIAGRVKSAMIYPIAVLIMAIGITGFLMVVIVPKFKTIFDELLAGQPLPGITEFVFNVSQYVQAKWWVVLCWIAGIFIFLKIIGFTKPGKYGIDYVKYYMPLFGPIISKTAISRFSRTLGTLMSSGVPVLHSLIIVRDTAGNELVVRAVQRVHDAVKEGEGIAAPLAAAGIFPQMVISMIEVGEETGKMPEMLEKIADTYEEEVDNAVDALTSMIEPLMIMFLAVIVGTIVIAMFAPLVKIMESLSG